MELETFVEPVRLAGMTRFVLCQYAFEFDIPRRLVCDDSGRICAFSTLEAAFTYAMNRGLALSDYPPGVDPTHDLDAVAAWTARPTADTLDHALLTDAWRFLQYARLLPGMYAEGLEPKLESVVWQLDATELATIDPKNAHLAPKWTEDELTVLATTLRRGIEDFAALMTSPAAV